MEQELMRFIHRISMLSATIVAGALSVSALSKEREAILVLTKDGSVSSAECAVKGIGRLAGVDPISGLFKVVLNSGVDVKSIKRQLVLSGKVTVAIGANQDHFDNRNDTAVSEHLTYLKFKATHLSKGTDKDEAAGLDWYGAYQHWLHDHVNRNGYFDPEPFIQGAKHRDNMPAGELTSGRSRAISGNWSYVGTHNEQPVPGRLFDGLGPLTGRINAVAVSPLNNSIVFVASAGGGVWKSTDKGATWAPLSDNWSFLQTSAIGLDPTNVNNVYAGTGDFPGRSSYSFGVMKSTDGGAHWTNYGAATFAGMAISRIVVDPGNAQIVIATAGRGANNTGGVFRSTNGGVTWAATTAPAGNYDGLDVSQPASGVRTFYAVHEGTNAALVVKSINDGLTWTPVTVPLSATNHTSIDVACSKISAGTVYILDPDNTNKTANHIWKSVNSGLTWSDKVAGFPNGDPGNGNSTWNQGDYNFYIGTSKIVDNSVASDGVFVGLITIAFSPDGGTTWQDISNSTGDTNTALSHVDQHGFCADPVSVNTVYFGNDGGTHRMVYDPGTQVGTFTPLNLNLYATQWYKVALHPTDATRIIGGLQDNACPASVGNLNLWINPGQGDGGFVAYDPFNPSIGYNSTQNLAIFRTTNGWGSAPTEITDPGKYNNEQMNQFPPVVLGNKGAAASVVYAGTTQLWKWDPTHLWVGDLGATALSATNLRIISPCPTDNNRLYTGSDDGMLWMTTNLGGTWTQVDGGFSNGQPIVAISPSTTSAVDVLAGITQTPGPNLFRCTNTAAATPVWTSVSGSGATALPAVPVNCIARDPAAPATTWYVGTDVGVFMTANAGATWANITGPRGLPNATVNDLAVNKTTGFLYAATYGRGLWKISLGSLTITAPTATISGNAFSVTVTLPAPAAAGGVLVHLASNLAQVTVPASVAIPVGSISKTFTATSTATLQSGPVSNHITATVGTTSAVSTTYIYPASVSKLAFSAGTITGGTTNPTATITLNAPAPAGFVVSLSSSDSATLSTPATVTVPAGTTTATFTLTSHKPATSPRTVTITAVRVYTISSTIVVN
jgi:hypothetical protein